MRAFCALFTGLFPALTQSDERSLCDEIIVQFDRVQTKKFVVMNIPLMTHKKVGQNFYENLSQRSKNNRYIFFNCAYTSLAVHITIGVIIRMLEKELAQATTIAQKAHKKVEQLRKELVAESERLHARANRRLSVTRKKRGSATAGLMQARAMLKARTESGNEQKVETLKKQVQELAQVIAEISKAACEAAEKYVTVKGDTTMVAKAKKKAAPKKKVAAKKAPAKKKAVAKKAPAKKKAVAKKAPAKKKAAAKKAPAKKAPAKKKAVAKKAPAKKKAVARKKK